MKAGQEKKPSLLTKVLPVSPKVYRAAFVHDGTPQISGWTNGHELGRQYAERVLSGRVVTKAYYNATDGDPVSLIEEAIRDGASILFTTSPRLLPASLHAAAVTGEIPPYEALTEIGKATVDLVGVPRSARPSGEKIVT